MAGIVHFEIPTDDNGRANTFYQSAFGWNLGPMQEDTEGNILGLWQTDSSGSDARQVMQGRAGCGQAVTLYL